MERSMKKNIIFTMSTAIICMILLVLKNQYSPLFLSHSTYGMPSLIKTGSVDNLYLGSSMFRQGLDIRILNDNLSSSQYILSYNGNQPAAEFYELKYLLDHDVNIQNIYIDMYVYSAFESPKISDEKLFMEMDIAGKYNLWSLLKDASTSSNKLMLFWQMWISSNNELLLTWPISAPIINHQFHSGGTLTQNSGSSAQTLNNTAVPSISSTINSIQKDYICALIQLARENNITVTFIETPKYQNVSHSTSYLQAMHTYTELLDQETIPYILSQSTYDALAVSSPVYVYNFDTRNPNYYIDIMHLSSTGRCEFSKLLTSYL